MPAERSGNKQEEPVYLGDVGRKLQDDSNVRLSRIGGRPVWSESLSASANVQRSDFLVCEICHKPMVLLGQFSAGYGSVPRRLLHVFSCSGSKCGANPRSWKVLRTTGPVDTFSEGLSAAAPAEDSTLGPLNAGAAAENWGSGEGDDWGVATWSDDWGTGGCSLDWSVAPDSTGALDSEIDSLLQARASCPANSSRVEPKRAASNSAACPEVWPGVAEPSVPETWPCMALAVYAEPEAVPECDGQHEQELYEKYLKEEREQGGAPEDLMKLSAEQRAELRKEEEGMKAEIDADAGKFDSDSDMDDDDDEAARTDAQWFQRFQRRLERSPNQVIRYSWGGEALWMAAPTAELRPGAQGPPCCPRCGARRIFELQILPTLVYQALRGIDDCSEPAWGTVAVFTCAKDCEARDPCEEFVVVQPAE